MLNQILGRFLLTVIDTCLPLCFVVIVTVIFTNLFGYKMSFLKESLYFRLSHATQYLSRPIISILLITTYSIVLIILGFLTTLMTPVWYVTVDHYEYLYTELIGNNTGTQILSNIITQEDKSSRIMNDLCLNIPSCNTTNHWPTGGPTLIKEPDVTMVNQGDGFFQNNDYHTYPSPYIDMSTWITTAWKLNNSEVFSNDTTLIVNSSIDYPNSINSTSTSITTELYNLADLTSIYTIEGSQNSTIPISQFMHNYAVINNMYSKSLYNITMSEISVHNNGKGGIILTQIDVAAQGLNTIIGKNVMRGIVCTNDEIIMGKYNIILEVLSGPGYVTINLKTCGANNVEEYQQILDWRLKYNRYTTSTELPVTVASNYDLNGNLMMGLYDGYPGSMVIYRKVVNSPIRLVGDMDEAVNPFIIEDVRDISSNSILDLRTVKSVLYLSYLGYNGSVLSTIPVMGYANSISLIIVSIISFVILLISMIITKSFGRIAMSNVGELLWSSCMYNDIYTKPMINLKDIDYMIRNDYPQLFLKGHPVIIEENLELHERLNNKII